MGSKQSGTQTVQQKADPWSGAQPYLTGGMSSGPQTLQFSGKDQKYIDAYNKGELNSLGMGYYNKNIAPRIAEANRNPGHKVVGILPEAQRLYKANQQNPFNADELSAMEAMRGRMGRDYGLVNTGLDTLQRTARGDFLGQQNFMDAYGEGILNDVNSQFSRSGRTGSGYAAAAAAKGLAQGAAPLYAQERQLQQQAAMAAPQYQAGQYGLLDSDIDALLQSGMMQQNRPEENLMNYANIVNAAAGQGGDTTTQQPLYSNRGAGMLGGAMAGYQMFGPYGAMAGGLLGGMS